MRNDNVHDIQIHARNMRKHILDMGKHAGGHAAHMGGALSIVDVLACLYFGVMNTVNVGMNSPERDRCILSKGHASLGLYSALIESGIMSCELKETFEDDYSDPLGHPVMNRKLGIEFTNGSLGMGLSIGIGVAIACKRRNYSNRVFVILGDGECNEGSCWEAFMSAPHFKLDNLVAIIDCNRYQLSGSTQEIMRIDNFTERLVSFGWNVKEGDGHDIEWLLDALSNDDQMSQPLAIVMNTIKGKGISQAENNNAWHHVVVTKNAYEQGIACLLGDDNGV